MNDPVVITQIIGFGMFLWLGAYLLLRSPQRSTITLVSVGGLLGQAAFWASSVWTYTTTSPATLVALERAFWWSAVLPLATWFHFCNLIVWHLTGRQRRGRDRLLVGTVYAAALVLLVLGTFTDLLTDYSGGVQQVDRYLDLAAGPAYILHIAYVAVVAAGALAYLLRALRSTARSTDPDARPIAAQLRVLLGGAVLFLVGALAIALAANADLKTLAVLLPAYSFLLGGLAIVGYGIARLGMLLEGQGITRDFFYGLTGITLLNIVYVLVLLPTGALGVNAVLALVLLVTLSHSLFDWGRGVWDRLFFNRDEQQARAEAREYANVLATDPVPAVFDAAPAEQIPAEQIQAEGHEAPTDPPPAALDVPDEKTFRTLVRRAITGIKSPPQLAKSPLLALELVEQRLAHSGQPDHRLNRMAALRELLIEQIEALQPGDHGGSAVSDAWRFYNVLYYPYVRGTNRKSALAEARRLAGERQRNGEREPGELEQVLHWLADVEEDTFYKWQRRASDTIATQLWEENERARQQG